MEASGELTFAIALQGMPITGPLKEVFYRCRRFDLLYAPPEIFNADLTKQLRRFSIICA